MTSKCIRQAISPRRRGAAGIRGLGAPGTAPSKQLVHQFCSLTGSPGLTPAPSNSSGAANNMGKPAMLSSAGPVALYRYIGPHYCVLLFDSC